MYLFLLIHLFCETPPERIDYRQWKSELWWSGGLEDPIWYNAPVIHPYLIYQVAAKDRKTAELLLEHTDIVELSTDEAAYFTEHERLNAYDVLYGIMLDRENSYFEREMTESTIYYMTEHLDVFRPYLVRGVGVNDYGYFEAKYSSGDLLIYHNSFAHNPKKLIRLPAVVFLSRRPSRVFCDAAFAE